MFLLARLLPRPDELTTVTYALSSKTSAPANPAGARPHTTAESSDSAAYVS